MLQEIIDFNTTAASFDDGLSLWGACHSRVERVVSMLERLTEHVGDHGVDEGAQSTAALLLTYFNEAAPRHHEDEERDIFPLLLAQLDAKPDTLGAADVRWAVTQLRRDHQDLDRMWIALRPHLEAIRDGRLSVPAPELVLLFIGRYRHHCGLEATVVHERMQGIVQPADAQAMAASILRRRGIDPATAPG
jgi:hypothetical protein